jgi:hypothetical protein
MSRCLSRPPGITPKPTFLKLNGQDRNLLHPDVRRALLATPVLHKSADKGVSGGPAGISPRPDQPVCYSMDAICRSGATFNSKVARSRLARPTRSEGSSMLRSSMSFCFVPTIASQRVSHQVSCCRSQSQTQIREMCSPKSARRSHAELQQRATLCNVKPHNSEGF